MILLPVPKQVEEREGALMLRPDTMIVEDGSCPRGTDVYAKLLQEEIAVRAGLSPERGRGTWRCGDILLKTDETLGERHYSLRISQEGAVACGGSLNALGQAVQTLRQIVRQYAGLLPCVAIEDEPDMENRGFYHDVTRGRVGTLDNLKKLADKAAFYKLNQLQLYVEHTYLFRDLTELWRDETPLTAEEIMELDRYCRERGIELIPSIATFGHLYKLLSTKSHEKFCEMPQETAKYFSYRGRMLHHTVDVSNPEVLPLIRNMIEEYMQLFSTDKFNICADETFDLGKGRSAALAGEKGTGRLYMEYINELFAFLMEKGKTPMFWGDIICRHPELYGELPKGVICLNWTYSGEAKDTNTKILRDAGATQYMCPGVTGWNNWINDIPQSYQNITKMCGYGRQYGAVGVLNTDWGDYGHINQPVFSVPGLIYGAVCSWGDRIPEYEELNRQISVLEFGDTSGELVSLLGQAAEKQVFTWMQAVDIMEWSREGDDREKILQALRKKDMTEVSEINEDIEEMRRRLRVISRSMDSGNRGVVEQADVALECIRVWNETGRYLACRDKGEQPENGEDIAAGLERCLYRYGKLWRAESKEGDFRAITDVFCWYADLLRSGRGI